jgi:hypothetical protein
MAKLLHLCLIRVLIFQFIFVHAVPSKTCVIRARRTFKASSFSDCHRSICGSLDTGYATSTFLNRLSDTCRAQMKTYRSPQAVAGGWLVRHDVPTASKCSTQRQSAHPTNPVVIELGYGSPFIMCTIPKVGCTNFRKLLRTLFLVPKLPPPNPTKQTMKAHFGIYSTLWHYHHMDVRLDDRYPSFALGRNPCASDPQALRPCQRRLATVGVIAIAPRVPVWTPWVGGRSNFHSVLQSMSDLCTLAGGAIVGFLCPLQKRCIQTLIIIIMEV